MIPGVGGFLSKGIGAMEKIIPTAVNAGEGLRDAKA